MVILHYFFQSNFENHVLNVKALENSLSNFYKLIITPGKCKFEDTPQELRSQNNKYFWKSFKFDLDSLLYKALIKIL